MVNHEIDSSSNDTDTDNDTDTEGHIRIQPDNKARTTEDADGHAVRPKGIDDADTDGHVTTVRS